MQDGDQDGCHNHNTAGILLLKRHTITAYKNSVLCLKCPFLIVHVIVKCFGFSYDPRSYIRRKMTTMIAAIIVILKDILSDKKYQSCVRYRVVGRTFFELEPDLYSCRYT